MFTHRNALVLQPFVAHLVAMLWVPPLLNPILRLLRPFTEPVAEGDEFVLSTATIFSVLQSIHFAQCSVPVSLLESGVGIGGIIVLLSNTVRGERRKQEEFDPFVGSAFVAVAVGQLIGYSVGRADALRRHGMFPISMLMYLPSMLCFHLASFVAVAWFYDTPPRCTEALAVAGVVGLVTGVVASLAVTFGDAGFYQALALLCAVAAVHVTDPTPCDGDSVEGWKMVLGVWGMGLVLGLANEVWHPWSATRSGNGWREGSIGVVAFNAREVVREGSLVGVCCTVVCATMWT
eukprot:Hpha_TRINITY_DN2699_c0_g1::TRINITY_DN2699_c0_g1_i1::g.145811::m.145811